MFKLTHKKKRMPSTISMGDMLPLQIGEITRGDNRRVIVMRTASSENFEVIDLTDAGEDNCWTSPNSVIPVRLFTAGESVTLTQT